MSLGILVLDSATILAPGAGYLKAQTSFQRTAKVMFAAAVALELTNAGIQIKGGIDHLRKDDPVGYLLILSGLAGIVFTGRYALQFKRVPSIPKSVSLDAKTGQTIAGLAKTLRKAPSATVEVFWEASGRAAKASRRLIVRIGEVVHEISAEIIGRIEKLAKRLFGDAVGELDVRETVEVVIKAFVKTARKAKSFAGSTGAVDLGDWGKNIREGLEEAAKKKGKTTPGADPGTVAAPKRAFEKGSRIHAPGLSDSLRNVKLAKGRKRLLELGFEELPPKPSGRITFRRTEAINGKGNQTYEIHFDPNDAGGPNWHKYVTDEHGQIYELNDRGYVEAFGTNNPEGRVHIRGRK